jgi:DNA-directed RNA polymerase subunit omega
LIKNEMTDLLKKVDSKYSLVILAAKRTRQINDYLNSIRKQELTNILPPQVDMETAIKAKPLSIAFEEILNDKITYEKTSESIK